MLKKIIAQLEKEISQIFHQENSGHDIYHLKRTLNLALKIQKKEGGDKLIIGIAAFLHDIHRIIQKETGHYCSAEQSLPRIKKLLNKIKLSEEQKKKILHCIKFHEEYNFSKQGKKIKNLETLILQDADNLDALGVIGIARAFSYGGTHKIPMWIPEIPLEKNIYDVTKNDPSEIHHFYNKLLKLYNNMNTKTGKKLAKERHEFIKEYLKRFFKEWSGK